MNDWPEREPTLADQIMGWAVALLVVFAAMYFGAHLLVAMGVGCGG